MGTAAPSWRDGEVDSVRVSAMGKARPQVRGSAIPMAALATASDNAQPSPPLTAAHGHHLQVLPRLGDLAGPGEAWN
ncbi:hypothetical protein PR202_gb12258 [Eleusine coracana subsp. coracana]|uniref:Uncharacterized protein n=1 Tax=Eleusine coracana subsp. coracana TaxID=191504 RepID=A0AAV5EPS3_ELECO|nr:hypothetical protein PR202_gb12258 [Eleusine coracana subsp. coracana]